MTEEKEKTSTPTGDVRALVEYIARSLVDAPGEVFIDLYEEDGETVIELEVAENDLGKVIGRGGRTARAFRTLLGAVGVRENKRFDLEILE